MTTKKEKFGNLTIINGDLLDKLDFQLPDKSIDKLLESINKFYK